VLPLSALEAVANETPASAATSWRVKTRRVRVDTAAPRSVGTTQDAGKRNACIRVSRGCRPRHRPRQRPCAWRGYLLAPFDRYCTLDVVRAVCASERGDEIALYTGNDDSIVTDLVTPFRVSVDGRVRGRSMVGGLLGQWAVGTRAAVRLLEAAHVARRDGTVPTELLALGSAWTDLNAAVFRRLARLQGCVAGINQVLHLLGCSPATAVSSHTMCSRPGRRLPSPT